MISLKEAKIKLEDIPLNIHQSQKATQRLKDKDETPTVMLHAGNINENTTLCLPTEEEWR